MKTTIDRAGRLVIPKEIRQQAGLKPGMALDVRFENGHIEIEPALAPVRLERRGHFLVAVSDDAEGQMPADIVERVLEEIERERFAQITGLPMDTTEPLTP